MRVLTPAAEPTNAPRRCPQTRFAARCGDGSCSLLRRCEQRTNNYRHSTATTRNPTVTALRQLRATAVTAGSNSWPRGKPEAERDCSNAQAGLVKRASAFAQDACCDSGRSKRLADPGCCTLATTCGPLVSVFGGPGGDACSRFDGENTCAACPPWRAAPPMTTEPRADGGVLVAGRGGLRLGAAAGGPGGASRRVGRATGVAEKYPLVATPGGRAKRLSRDPAAQGGVCPWNSWLPWYLWRRL